MAAVLQTGVNVGVNVGAATAVMGRATTKATSTTARFMKASQSW